MTAGGVEVTRRAEPFDEQLLAGICAQAEQVRGGVLSSGMEYPGRYSRWHLAYLNPCLELIGHGRRISARALNARGE
ncbi:MAG TPA: anthranilate synthase component I, partial [Streptosporangiaceae bacterium]